MSEDRGPRRAVRAMRRAYPGYLRGIADLDELIRELNRLPTLEQTLQALDQGCQERTGAEALCA